MLTLIVDTNTDYLKIYKAKMADISEVVFCSDPKMVDSYLQSNQFDLVLISDILSGTESVKIFHKVRKSCSCPVIILSSGNHQDQILSKFKKVRVRPSILNKGMNSKDFLSFINSICGGKEGAVSCTPQK